MCPDCVKCLEELDSGCVEYTYLDFSESLKNLKEFLRLRDSQPVFDEVRAGGYIGIPCILRDDGTVTLDWDEFVHI